jgi:hypothetical protein
MHVCFLLFFFLLQITIQLQSTLFSHRQRTYFFYHLTKRRAASTSPSFYPLAKQLMQGHPFVIPNRTKNFILAKKFGFLGVSRFHDFVFSPLCSHDFFG